MDALFALGGSLLNGLFNIAGTSSANYQSFMNTKATNEANLRLAREQNEFNYRMWQENNLYNSPQQQVKRLQAAGLSAAAAAQSVSGIPSQPVQSANLANQQAPPQYQVPDLSGANIITAFRDLMQAKEMKATAGIKEKENEYANDYFMSRAEAQRWAVKHAQQEFEQKAKSFPYKLGILQSDKVIRGLMEKYQDLSNKLLDANIKITQQRYDFLDKYNEHQIREICERIRNLKTSSDLNEAQQGLVEAQTAGQSQENRILKVKAGLQEYGLPESFVGKIITGIMHGTISESQVAEGVQSLWKFAKTGALDAWNSAKSYLGDLLDVTLDALERSFPAAP